MKKLTVLTVLFAFLSVAGCSGDQTNADEVAKLMNKGPDFKCKLSMEYLMKFQRPHYETHKKYASNQKELADYVRWAGENNVEHRAFMIMGKKRIDHEAAAQDVEKYTCEGKPYVFTITDEALTISCPAGKHGSYTLPTGELKITYQEAGAAPAAEKTPESPEAAGQ